MNNPRAGRGASALTLAGSGFGNLANAGKLHVATGRGATPKEFNRYPFVPWEQLEPRIKWRQGEHVICIGGTGSGKTTLSAQLLPRRSHVAVTVSKGADPTFSKEFTSRGFERIDKWPPPRDYMNKVLVWPANGRTTKETREIKQRVFRHMFDRILLHEGGWCIDIDELHYMCASLRLEAEVTDLEEQGRSHGISIWGNAQRPAGIPLACYSNASHGFFYQTQEEYDVQRLASMNTRDTNARELEANIRVLTRHEFVYIDRYGDVPPVRSKLSL